MQKLGWFGGLGVTQGHRKHSHSTEHIRTLVSENQSPGAIVWHYLRDPTFSRFDTIPECDRHTHRNTTTAYTALSIASRGKNKTKTTTTTTTI